MNKLEAGRPRQDLTAHIYIYIYIYSYIYTHAYIYIYIYNNNNDNNNNKMIIMILIIVSMIIVVTIVIVIIMYNIYRTSSSGPDVAPSLICGIGGGLIDSCQFISPSGCLYRDVLPLVPSRSEVFLLYGE